MRYPINKATKTYTACKYQKHTITTKYEYSRTSFLKFLPEVYRLT